jgi:hypothetical protein
MTKLKNIVIITVRVANGAAEGKGYTQNLYIRRAFRRGAKDAERKRGLFTPC